MAIIKTRAITLKTIDYSDTSQVLLLLAGEHGVVHVLARGSRRAKSRFQGAIDVMTLNEVVYYEKRSELHQLAEVDQVTTFPGLRTSLARAGCAAYACELTHHLAQDSQHPKELFDLLHDTLYTMENGEALPLTLFSFEFAALRLAGYAPLLDRCVECGAPWTVDTVHRPPSTAHRTAAFSPVLGGLLCTECRTGEAKTVPVAAGVVSIARALADGRAKTRRLKILPAQARGLRGLLDSFVETIVNTRLKSRKFLKAL